MALWFYGLVRVSVGGGGINGEEKRRGVDENLSTYSENRVCVENKAIIYDEGRFNDIGDFSLIFLLLKTSLCHRVVNVLL